MLKFSAPFVCSVLVYATSTFGLERTLSPAHEAHFVQIINTLKDQNSENKLCLPALEYIAQQPFERYIKDREYIDLARSMVTALADTNSVENIQKIGWRAGTLKKEQQSDENNERTALIAHTHFELHLVSGILATIYMENFLETPTKALEVSEKIAIQETLNKYLYNTVKGYTLLAVRLGLMKIIESNNR